MRILNFILAIMFLSFAFLQLNDPDPVIWILIYGSVAVSCVLAAFEIYSPKFLIALAALLVIYSLTFIQGVMTWLGTEDKTTLFSEEMKAQFPYIEESREFLGLWICILILGLYIFRALKKGR
jgi:hypothetical protein